MRRSFTVTGLGIALAQAIPLFGQSVQKAESAKRFMPNANNAEMVFCTQDWIVWLTKEVVPETRGWVKPLCNYRCHLQSEPLSPAKFVYAYQDSAPLHTVGLRADGSMLLQGYMRFLLVKPDEGCLEIRRS